ncbi:hypothetical protein QBC44DRAFT_287338 [Cladorrhinum sp. PSN332]|nr:hypothetical protein QBC44DRAFT_287338 [Cladorrhinum sp. PSN332]
MEPVNNSSLPLGLIETTREIFLEVASYPVLPPEKIQAYWNAYTITFRTVVDPTALRLENFWWHVWGSDRRYLPGPVLARLFKEFALGPTFAPLVQSQRPPLTWKPTSDQNHNQQQKSSPSESRKERGSASSSSKYPPAPRPILKKNRGPSGSGPRPTARFLDPPTTHERKPGGDNSSPPDTAAAAPREIPSSTSHKQDDAEPQAAIPQDTPSSAAKPEPGPLKEMPPPPKPPPKRRTSSTPAASTSGTDMRPPRQTSPASGGKVTLPTGKKIVASTAASRRRPIMPRRQSSQSTAGSPTTRLVSPVGTTAVKQGGTRRPSTEAKASEETAITESPQASESQLSEKAADKRPMREPSQTSPQKASPSLRPTTKSSSTQQKTVQTDGPWNQPEKPLPTRRRGSAKQEAPQPQVKAVMQTQVIYGFNPPCQRPALQEKQNVPQTKVAQNNAQITQSRPPVAGFVTEAAQQQQQQQQQRAGNRNTRGNTDRIRSYIEVMAAPSAAGVITPTNVEGRIASDTLIYPDTLPEARDLPDKVRYAKPPLSSVLEPKFKPTPRDPKPHLQFGRSRSELFLLLERSGGSNGGSAASRPPV